tara:strand:+ start:84 stop:266 length:183 start_codon:yes stop_codon:yes gene_type:complete
MNTFDIYSSKKEALAETAKKKRIKKDMRRVMKRLKEQDRKLNAQLRKELNGWEVKHETTT